MNYSAVIAIPVLLSATCLAGNGKQIQGAVSAAMGGTYSCHTGVFSFAGNPAGTAALKKTSLASSYENRFLIRDLSIKSLAVAVPFWKGCFSLNGTFYGNENYNERKAGGGYAMSFGNIVSAGIQFSLNTVSFAEPYGKRTVLTADLGLQYQISPGTTLGATIHNPFARRPAEPGNESPTTILCIGLSRRVSQKVILTSEIEKDFNLKPQLKCGAEYQPRAPLFFRCGISTGAGLFSFGFGLQLTRIRLDMAAAYHSQLGYSPNVSLTYGF